MTAKSGLKDKSHDCGEVVKITTPKSDTADILCSEE